MPMSAVAASRRVALEQHKEERRGERAQQQQANAGAVPGAAAAAAAAAGAGAHIARAVWARGYRYIEIEGSGSLV